MNTNKQTLRIGEAAKLLGVTTQTLRNWEKSGRIQPHRTLGKQRYYVRTEIEHLQYNFEDLGWAWASSLQVPELPSVYYCEHHDRFTSRLEKMSRVLMQNLGNQSESLVSLLVLMAGEIGDNSFAHNLGNWPDVPGIFFAYDLYKREIILADRGRGIRATLQRVRDIESDADALKIAFTEVVSGRSPENRGNGLKVVRYTAESHGMGIFFRSGLAVANIPQDSPHLTVSMVNQNVRGVYAIVRY